MKKAAKISIIILTAAVTLIAVLFGVFFLVIEPEIRIFGASDIDFDKISSPTRTVTVIDGSGKPLEDAFFGKNKIYVNIDELHDYTVNAFVAIEDKRFYKHGGVDYKRMASALLSNVKARRFKQGASTITQQLIKNTHLNNDKTIKRKIDEIRLARKLERMTDKRTVLEGYLNVLYFGSGIRGLGTASRVMFAKPASQLTLAQSAALASIINNPTKYNPYTNYDNLCKRKNLVLKQMLEQEYIDKAQYRSALDEDVSFGKDKQRQYVSALLKEAEQKLGCTEKELFAQNTTLYTEYDPECAALARRLLEGYKDFTARVLIINNATGGVVCDETNAAGYINPQRSPASAIKPFLSYAPALESGYSLLHQIDDRPTDFGGYAPKNYKDVYRGYITLKDCLSYSSNIAAVKLTEQVGIDKCKAAATRFGINLSSDDKTLPIALGGLKNGVTLNELANAYSTLARGGIYKKTHYLAKAKTDKEHNFKEAEQRAVGDDTAYLITRALSECARNGTAKKLKYCDNIAAKTGTNGDADGNTDCYCIAYTKDLTIAVWFGASEKPIPNNITGASCCDVVKEIYSQTEKAKAEKFDIPSSVACLEIDNIALQSERKVYLAEPSLPLRYRIKEYFSTRFVPIKKQINIIDYYDFFQWNDI